ncbi:hypothetical protein V8E54_010577 [Elaphomyces granulatus]
MWGTIASILAGIVLVAAWIAGYLDPYQRQLQEYVLDKMGETKQMFEEGVSDNKIHVVEDKNVNAIQDNVGNQAGGLFGKGGVAHGIGGTVGRNI